jgi:FkbM family methyltransferase
VALTASVVIATRDRPAELAACLRALADQDDAAPFDVVVVDDGSLPPAVAPAAASPEIRVIRTAGIGPGQARNVGVAATRADVILFTDDDVVVDRHWVSRAAAWLDANPDHLAVEGVVHSRPWDPLYENSVETSAAGHHWTCNIAYRRSALAAVGGFSAGFPAAHGEDRDLGLRIAALGPIGFDREMVVTHTPRRLAMGQMIRRGRLVASDIELERRHPGVFPPGRIARSGRVMPPLRLARDWVVRARPDSPYRPRTPRRAGRFLMVAGGQVALAAWWAWGPRTAQRRSFEAEVARQPRDAQTAARAAAGGAKAIARLLLPAPLYRVYRQRRVARGLARYARRRVTHTYGGTELTIELADDLAEAWYDHDWLRLPELERLRDHGLVPGARVFDIGAHQGVVALMLADIVGASGHVLAVEAEPHNARIAQRNLAANGATNVTVMHAAGAASPGSVLFAESLNGHVEDRGPRWGKVDVRAVTIDELAARYGEPDVVMIDVEGFEGEVLAGAAQTVARGRAAFLVEVHVDCGLSGPPEDVIAVFGAFRRLVAPAWGETDRFVAYGPASAAVAERFFLLATPQ